jgi:hypothetical protein
MVIQNLCPVCGFEMAEPPSDYNICPSCGTEFGLHDQNATLDELRMAWLKTGPVWWSRTEPQPLGWSPLEQISRLAPAIKSGATTDFQAPWAGVAELRDSRYAGTVREMAS